MAVVWFFGLPCSGKTTIANAFKAYINSLSSYPAFKPEVITLDGDVTRRLLNPKEGFSKKDRIKNVTRIAKLAKTLSDLNKFVICSYVTPYNEMRRKVRKIIGDALTLVYVYCPVDVCEERDVKGMYKKARDGEIKNFTGIDGAFEDPYDVDIVLMTNTDKLKDTLARLVRELREIHTIYW